MGGGGGVGGGTGERREGRCRMAECEKEIRRGGGGKRVSKRVGGRGEGRRGERDGSE